MEGGLDFLPGLPGKDTGDRPPLRAPLGEEQMFTDLPALPSPPLLDQSVIHQMKIEEEQRRMGMR